jgi:hypothetical protein
LGHVGLDDRVKRLVRGLSSKRSSNSVRPCLVRNRLRSREG